VTAGSECCWRRTERATILALNAAVSSGSGSITVLANNNVNQAAAGGITVAGGAGTIDVERRTLDLMATARWQTLQWRGNIRYRASGDVSWTAGRGRRAVVVVAEKRGDQKERCD